MEHESQGITNCGWCAWNGPQEPGEGTGTLEIRGRIETIQHW